MYVGKEVPRVDAADKVTGRAMFTEDLCDQNALVGKILHANIPHGYVKHIDISKAAALDGVLKVVTCFDVPDRCFPTAGHPWSVKEEQQDIADRKLLDDHVRFYGDDIAAVVAVDEVIANQALRLIEVDYEELSALLTPEAAMAEGAPLLHDRFKNNILAHTNIRKGNVTEAIKEEGLIRVDGEYTVPAVQHCHIENAITYAYVEGSRLVVVSSTQLPHICRRIVAQAIGWNWGKVRVIKPYIGGGFGNKQDILYEPLTAFLSLQVGGRLVKIDTTREETFVCQRVRHPMKYQISSWVRSNGDLVARKMVCIAEGGAYAAHGHSVAGKGQSSLGQIYPCDNLEADTYTVYTNKPTSGAMRGYGMPQITFALDSHTQDIAEVLGREGMDYRNQIIMPDGFVEPISKNENYFDSYRMCMKVGAEAFDYHRKLEEYKNQSGPIRKGVGLATFWYNTSIWPFNLEVCSCRMVMNQDGSVQMQLAETEIGQGADTVFAQMAADTLGIDINNVHVISQQDTDVVPFGTGAYASRQTYIGGTAVKQTGLLLKEKVLKYAEVYTQMPAFHLDIIDGKIVRATDGRELTTLAELSMDAVYNREHAAHFTAESTYQTRSNAYSLGCAFAEIEVDIPMCKIKVLRLLNVHDAGTIINPMTARGQVYGGQSMAIGYALTEELLYDEKTGRTLNDNLLDYKLCTTLDHPDLEYIFIENAEPTGAFGTKSLGEPPVLPVAPAIRNALLQATGVAMTQLPMSPHKLYQAFLKNGLLKEDSHV